MVETDYSGEDYNVYSYYVENTCDRVIVIFNYRFKDEAHDFEVYEGLPGNVLVLQAYQTLRYLKVKATAEDSPVVNWNAKFMEATEEYSQYPVKNKDYVYHYKSYGTEDGYLKYSYHLHNLSDKEIKFHNFTLTNEGGTYYLIDNLLHHPVVTQPGTSIQLVRFNLKEGTDAPSANWYADWPAFEAGSDEFCQKLIEVLEASREEEFASIKGPIKQSAEESLLGTEIYYSKTHIPGTIDEEIEYLWFFWEYHCNIGGSGTESDMLNLLEEYRLKVKSCIPVEMHEAEVVGEDLISAIKGFTYEGTVEDVTHYISLKVQPDYDIDGNYYLELSIEEIY